MTDHIDRDIKEINNFILETINFLAKDFKDNPIKIDAKTNRNLIDFLKLLQQHESEDYRLLRKECITISLILIRLAMKFHWSPDEFVKRTLVVLKLIKDGVEKTKPIEQPHALW